MPADTWAEVRVRPRVEVPGCGVIRNPVTGSMRVRSASDCVNRGDLENSHQLSVQLDPWHAAFYPWVPHVARHEFVCRDSRRRPRAGRDPAHPVRERHADESIEVPMCLPTLEPACTQITGCRKIRNLPNFFLEPSRLPIRLCLVHRVRHRTLTRWSRKNAKNGSRATIARCSSPGSKTTRTVSGRYSLPSRPAFRAMCPRPRRICWPRLRTKAWSLDQNSRIRPFRTDLYRPIGADLD